MGSRLSIAVYFDLICPWCWIGKRHLDEALRQLGDTGMDVEVDIQWRGVQLLPMLPSKGMPFADFYLKRLGSTAAVQARQAQVQTAARAVGLQIDFSKIPTMPNTAKAHKLLVLAEKACSPAQQDALIERLFRAHFVLGRDLGDGETLLSIARLSGLDTQTPAERMDTTAPLLQQQPVPQGVPLFVFNGESSLSGAQPPGVLLDAMRKSTTRLPDQAMVPSP